MDFQLVIVIMSHRLEKVWLFFIVTISMCQQNKARRIASLSQQHGGRRFLKNQSCSTYFVHVLFLSLSIFWLFPPP